MMYNSKTRYVHFSVQHSEIHSVVQRMTTCSVRGFNAPPRSAHNAQKLQVQLLRLQSQTTASLYMYFHICMHFHTCERREEDFTLVEGKRQVGNSWRLNVLCNTGNCRAYAVFFNIFYLFQDQWSYVNSNTSVSWKSQSSPDQTFNWKSESTKGITVTVNTNKASSDLLT